MQKQEKWYQKTLWIIVLLIVFFPAGLFLMWKYSTWNKWVKISVSAIFALSFIIAMVSEENTTTQTNDTQVIQEQAAAETIKPTEEKTTAEPPAPKTAIEQINEICPKADVYVTGSILYIRENMKRTKRAYYHAEAKEVYNNIHNLLDELPPEITTICVWYDTEFIDKLGNESTDTVYRINMPIDTLKSINWDNYIGLDFEDLSNGDMYAWQGLK